MSPDTRNDENTEVVRGHSNVKQPPPPPAVKTVEGLDEVTQMIFRSFMVEEIDYLGCREQYYNLDCLWVVLVFLFFR